MSFSTCTALLTLALTIAAATATAQTVSANVAGPAAETASLTGAERAGRYGVVAQSGTVSMRAGEGIAIERWEAVVKREKAEARAKKRGTYAAAPVRTIPDTDHTALAPAEAPATLQRAQAQVFTEETVAVHSRARQPR